MADLSWAEMLAEAGDSFDPAPPGTYKVSVKSAEAKVSKGGNPMIIATLKVAEGPHTGKTVTQFITKSKNAAGMFFGNLSVLGIKPQTVVEKNPTMEQLAAVIVGKHAVAVVEATDKNQAGVGVKGTLKAPEKPNAPVTSFPLVSEAASLGYETAAPKVPTVEDVGF